MPRIQKTQNEIYADNAQAAMFLHDYGTALAAVSALVAEFGRQFARNEVAEGHIRPEDAEGAAQGFVYDVAFQLVATARKM